MEPIISPLLIYLLEIVNNINVSFCIFSIIFGIIFVFFVIFYIIFTIEKYEPNLKIIKKFTWIIYVFILSLILNIFIPSRNTVIGMIVAKQITPDNIKSAAKVGKDLKDEIKKDVLEIILAVTEKNKVDSIKDKK